MPRRFTEAPLGDEGGPEEEKVPLPAKGEGEDNQHLAEEGLGREETLEHAHGELKTGEEDGGGGEREVLAQHPANGSTHEKGSDDAHLMSPPSVPSARAAVSSISMPPPSFKPLHPRVATSE